MKILFTLQFPGQRRLSFIAALIFFLNLLAPLTSRAQSESFWQDVNTGMATSFGPRYSTPEKFRAVYLDINSMRSFLKDAPLEFSEASRSTSFIVSIPMPNGSMNSFEIFESPVMAPGLATKYQSIKTYAGRGITDPRAHIRLDVTNFGFHAMILSPRGDVFIDPISNESADFYIVYNKSDLHRSYDFECGVSEEEVNILNENKEAQPQFRSSGTELRTYRLALACTGEYAATKGGTVSGALAGMVTSVNRVTGIYETEVAIRMQLIENDTVLIYLNSTTDPYTNNNGGIMLDQNQQIIDDTIGVGNYDIGHVFSTGGGGIAYLGAVCRFGAKAQGVTGLPNPVGDAFDVDYVAHEMGHQYGANHPFNATTGACGGGNRNGSTAWEPGSGSTIMAYAGICAPNNLQPHSDPFFHTGSFDEILDYTLENDGGSCPVIINTGNTPPEVNAGLDYSIPILTPFKLDGSGSDVDGDSLSFMWEELDKGPACDWDEPSGNAPCFRSWKADTVASRYFPKLFNVINGTTLIGEVLPDYSRSLKFRLTARDNALSGGGVTYNEDIVTLSVVNTTVPFKVTFPDTQQPNIAIGTPTNINWDVATTDVSPINCPTVKILLSIDGGYTYPVTLAENTANDGYEVVMVPMDVNLLTSDARIMVQSVGNVFYDISDNDFNITDNVGIGGPGALDAEVDVFPNPVNGTLNVAIDGLTTAQAVISIQDVVGRIVAEKIITDTHMPQQFTFDMNSMIPGIYMVGIKCDDGSMVKKIVKQ